jgi:hypothetical protein
MTMLKIFIRILNRINRWIYTPINILFKSKNYRFDANYKINKDIREVVVYTSANFTISLKCISSACKLASVPKTLNTN